MSIEGGKKVFMKENEKASLSLSKIICVGIILLIFSGIGIGVLATNTQISNVKIILSNNYEMNVVTSKSKISEILEENHIVVLPDEVVSPELESEITANKVIKITKEQQGQEIVKLAEQNEEITMDKILESYSPIVEKIVVEREEIPFETITKDVSNNSGDKENKVLQEGKNGIKEITYKIKYQKEVEIEKNKISENIIEEPVNKVIQVNTKITSRAKSVDRTAQSVAQAASASNSLAKRVEGKVPTVRTMNTSAYTASTCGKAANSPGYGKTSSGAKASAWYTIAAGGAYPIGTVVYIPYFSNKPNGGWFVVQDRGGAISNNRIDVYMNTYNECISFGRRNLECYVYN